MPAAIPIIAAFASGAAGAVIAGTATLAQFVSVAGAVLSGVGALTGSKDLMKIGAVLSIGGGLASMASGAIEAGSAAASTAADKAAIGATFAAETAAPLGDYAGAAGMAAAEEAAGLASAGGAVQGAATGAAAATNPFASMAPEFQTASNTSMPTSPMQIEGALDPAQNPIKFGQNNYNFDGNEALQKGAKNMGKPDLDTWLDKFSKAGGAVGEFIEKNKSLMKVGGDMLNSMYGPAAEANKLRQQEIDRANLIYEENKKRLNSPIKFLYNAKPAGG